MHYQKSMVKRMVKINKNAMMIGNISTPARSIYSIQLAGDKLYKKVFELLKTTLLSNIRFIIPIIAKVFELLKTTLLSNHLDSSRPLSLVFELLKTTLLSN